MYYFNSEGYGFRIPNIGPNTDPFYRITVEVGDEIWDYENPAGGNFSPELKETFVIQVDDDAPSPFAGEKVNGYIDNIRMTRVYDVIQDENGETMFDEKTVTFSEDVNGWTSFKSFIPESGLSLSKKYFTIDKAGLFEHYMPLDGFDFDHPGVGFWSNSTLKDATNYNVFYNNPNPGSYVKVILNNEPSTVKTFHTLNYEGSNAYIIKPSNAAYINTNNALAWNQRSDIRGWSCEEIKTNLDNGTVLEFIEKEGKWFNYIKGKANESLDTSLFSVQGIGFSSSIENWSYTTPNLSNTSSGGTGETGNGAGETGNGAGETGGVGGAGVVTGDTGGGGTNGGGY